MILDIVNSVLRNFRGRMHWAVYQSTELLAKGSTDIDELWDTIKNTEYNVLTEKEIKEKQEIAFQKQMRIKKLKKKKRKKIEPPIELITLYDLPQKNEKI